MTTSPRDGLNGQIKMLSLMADSIQLDTLRLNFVSDSTNITFNGQVRNNVKNPQFVFNTLFDGFLMERGAGVNVRYYDAQDKLGVRLGAEAAMEENGIRLHLKSKDAVIAYRDAHINEDNYVFLADNRRVSANLDILAEDGTGVKLYSNDDNEEGTSRPDTIAQQAESGGNHFRFALYAESHRIRQWRLSHRARRQPTDRFLIHGCR